MAEQQLKKRNKGAGVKMDATSKFAVLEYPGVTQPPAAAPAGQPAKPPATTTTAKPKATEAPKTAAAAPPPPATSTNGNSASTPLPPLPTVPMVANVKSHDAASAKVVWASLAFDVPLQVDNDKSKGSGKHASLTLPGSVSAVSGGGNAMALAVSMLSPSSGGSSFFQSLSVMEQMLQDEWCEWERTVLRKAKDDKTIAAALEHLSTSLSAGDGVHLVGSRLTVADICVLSTLNNSTFVATAPAAAVVTKYLQAHASQWKQVQAKVDELASSSAGADDDDWHNNPSLVTVVDRVFRAALHDLYGLTADTLPATIVTKCSNPKHGDYQCSAAMPAFAALKKSGQLPPDIQSPPQVAHSLVAALGPQHQVLTDLNVNGPGFVSGRIRAALLQHHVNAFLQTQRLPLPANIAPQVCVVDFSSPNIAKEMHVGHLRSTIIGEAVCRLLELVGHQVHRVNHVGDWGTQFGMLIQYLKEEYPDVAQAGNQELPNITDLTHFYKSAKARFDDDADFKKQSQLNVVQLQSGNAECLRIWKLLCDVSRVEFEKVYRRLDVTVTECGESFYNDKIPAVIQEFQQAGLLTEEGQGGAKVVFVDGYKVPLMLQKSDGGYGYDSTDMAALKYRLFELKADRIICITDFSQGDHFAMVFKAGEKIGWLDRNQRLQHIGFGTVQGEDGKRFKTRSGDTVRLVDLLDEAAARLQQTLEQRIQDGASHITKTEAHDVAEAIGYGSVKYFDLRRNPTSNYKFSYDQMLDTKGDTGVYLLYARVRLESILAKAQNEHGVDLDALQSEPVQIGHASERNVCLALQQFPDVLTLTLDDLYPYHICHYVYELSIAASDFVTQCRVLGSPEMKSRLRLCQATILAMKQAFDLLGIRHVKRI